MSKADMPEDIRRNINEAVFTAGGVAPLAKIAGVSPRTVYAWKKGDRSPTLATYGKLTALLQARTARNILAIVGADAVEETPGAYRPSAPGAFGECMSVPFYEDEEDGGAIRFARRAPLYGSRPPEALRFVRMRGRSMEPTLRHNDLCLMDTADRVLEEDAIYVVRHGAEIYIRRYCPTPGRLRFMGDNRSLTHGDFDLPEADDGLWRIVGRVFWLGRSV